MEQILLNATIYDVDVVKEVLECYKSFIFYQLKVQNNIILIDLQLKKDVDVSVELLKAELINYINSELFKKNNMAER